MICNELHELFVQQGNILENHMNTCKQCSQLFPKPKRIPNFDNDRLVEDWELDEIDKSTTGSETAIDKI